MFDQVRELSRSRPAIAFVVVAYALSWSIWGVGYLVVPDGVPYVPVVLLGVFGPAVGAALVTRATGGSVRAWLADILDWRVEARWYLAALVVPVVIYLIAAVVLVAEGATLQPDRLGRGVLLFLTGLVPATLVTGGNEELGWRGFLLPRLQRRHDALTASVVVGLVWAGWHLPVYALPLGLANGPFVLFVPFAVLASVVLTWVYNGTDGSALLAMVTHGSINSAVGIFVGVLTVDAVDETVLWGARIVGALVVVALLVALYGSESLAGDSSGRVRHQS